MWGPCYGHRRAMFWPFQRKGATGYAQQFEIWYRKSLGTLIEIQEEAIWRTMWEPCFGQERPYFGHFEERGLQDMYTQQCEIWYGAYLGTLIKIQEELIWRTMWGPCFGIKVVIFWPHLGLQIHWVVKWKTGHSCRPLVLCKACLSSWTLIQNFWTYEFRVGCSVGRFKSSNLNHWLKLWFTSMTFWRKIKKIIGRFYKKITV